MQLNIRQTSSVCQLTSYGIAILPLVTDHAPPEQQPPSLTDAVAAWSATSLAGRPARLSVVVISVLVEEIVSGRYPPGSLLPPEPELCRSFDVSRPVVREAMKALEEKGLAHAQQGRGTTITPPDEWNLLDPMVLEAMIRDDE